MCIRDRSIHYGEVSQFITDYTRKHTRKLIEAAAEDLATALLLHYPLLKGVTLELKKPWAPVGLPLETVSVKISRFWHRAYIALGSNLGDKKAYFCLLYTSILGTLKMINKFFNSRRVTDFFQV